MRNDVVHASSLGAGSVTGVKFKRTVTSARVRTLYGSAHKNLALILKKPQVNILAQIIKFSKYNY